ncbi:cytochrome P450 [Artemisia annua]|uniref:Cytochrome P450 n=1 Tax=Artemisia annua TaxID=35608 RepID=A0A2U1P610_ARTAN|nr:cytochrome P450 [Artemisia annua]
MSNINTLYEGVLVIAEKEGGTNIKIILIGVFLGIFVISLSTWLWYSWRKRHLSLHIEGGSLIGESGREAVELPLFSFSRVAKATAMFSLDNKLGEGGFGPVYKPPLPPGPKPLPYIGNLITMLQNKPTFRWVHLMMDEMNTKILCIRLANIHVIVVSDPKIACEFLKDQDGIFSSRPDCMSGYLTSGGYLNTSLAPMGDYWKRMRKILATEILSVARHKWLQNKRDEEADNLLSVRKELPWKVEATGNMMKIGTLFELKRDNTIHRCRNVGK